MIKQTQASTAADGLAKPMFADELNLDQYLATNSTNNIIKTPQSTKSAFKRVFTSKSDGEEKLESLIDGNSKSTPAYKSSSSRNMSDSELGFLGQRNRAPL